MTSTFNSSVLCRAATLNAKCGVADHQTLRGRHILYVSLSTAVSGLLTYQINSMLKSFVDVLIILINHFPLLILRLQGPKGDPEEEQIAMSLRFGIV
uniref:Uncharacterized protein n=1 Tax=Lactuca sativa TaxID=4236 RepID=A0A9R1WCJ1_LACSA|nr:hypothetical protein LSAT_V11C200097590 [Lactuca sativa]